MWRLATVAWTAELFSVVGSIGILQEASGRGQSLLPVTVVYHIAPRLPDFPACSEGDCPPGFLRCTHVTPFVAPLREPLMYGVAVVLCIMQTEQFPPYPLDPATPHDKVFTCLPLVTHWACCVHFQTSPGQPVSNLLVSPASNQRV